MQSINIHAELHTVEPPMKFGWTGKSNGLLTINRTLSRLYLSLLQKKNEIAQPLRSTEILSLFDAQKKTIESYTKGSMVFISGAKTAT